MTASERSRALRKPAATKTAHQTEPGCAVLAATDSGALSAERLESFRALQKELRYLRVRQDASAQHAEKRKWRAINREMRRSGRHRRM